MSFEAWRIKELKCGCKPDGASYCALCLKCEAHCECPEEEREAAWKRLLEGLADQVLAEKEAGKNGSEEFD